jgi:hypothetical protein
VELLNANNRLTCCGFIFGRKDIEDAVKLVCTVVVGIRRENRKRRGMTYLEYKGLIRHA